jgi:general nucleoside transport system ATP-binding protein
VRRDGRTIRSGAAATETAASLAAAMLGESPPLGSIAPPAVATGPALVRGRGVTLRREDGRGVALQAADVSAVAGEVLGVAAVDGSGQRELLRSVAGFLRPFDGTLEVAEPIAFVPEDRTTEGLILELPVAHNVALGLGPPGSWKRGGRMDWAAIRSKTREVAARFGIRGGEPAAAAGTLSGGNQQKLVVARALARRPRVIVAENPTRGLDVHAAGAVWSALKEAAAGGAAVLVWSSDLDEIMLHSTRLIVVARGVVRSVPAGTGREAVGAMMLGSAAVTGRP